MRRRWNIPEKVLDGLVAKAANIALGPDSSTRDRLAAIRVLQQMESANQADEHKVVDVQIPARNHNISAISSDLGTDESVIEDAARAARLGFSGD